MDAGFGGGGDGVLVGSEIEEVPVIGFGLVTDAFADVVPSVEEGGVFLAVGEDGDDDGGWAVVFREGSEAFSEVVDAGGDGVEQGGGAARDEDGGIEWGDFRQGQAGDGVIEAVVEEHEGEAGESGLGGLVLQEAVKTGDGGLGERGHGAGAIKDEEDFSEVGAHGVVGAGVR